MNESRTLTREVLEALLIAVIFATFARTYVVQAFKIPTGSMEENLLVGDHILVNKFIYGPVLFPLERRLLPLRLPRRGDVVVFKYPEDPTRDFIKRCIGLPDDVVEIAAKRLYIDDQEVDDASYTYHSDPRTYPDSPFVNEYYRRRDNFGPFRVPSASYFCLGDNRDNSKDSRFWGTVPASYLKGRALLIYWSFGGPQEETGWPGFGSRIRHVLGVARRFFQATRWGRTFHIVR